MVTGDRSPVAVQHPRVLGHWSPAPARRALARRQGALHLALALAFLMAININNKNGGHPIFCVILSGVVNIPLPLQYIYTAVVFAISWIPRAATGSLAGLVKKFGPLPEPTVKTYLTQMLCGLEYLHSQNVAHRCGRRD
jgi:hypothetical protein